MGLLESSGPFGGLLAALLVAHLLSDFVLQTDRFADAKRRGLASGALLAHGLVTAACAVAALAPFVPARAALAAGLLLGAVHLGIDAGKIALELRLWRERGTPIAGHLVDQALHVATLAVAARWLARAAGTGPLPWSPAVARGLGLVLGLLAVTWGAGALAFQVRRALGLAGRARKADPARDPHWPAMARRVATAFRAAGFLAGFFHLWPLVIVLAVTGRLLALPRSSRDRDFARCLRVELVVGLASVLAAALLLG